MNTQIIAIANQKGGVGKTTTCANLGIGLAQAGKKVLLIDGDPQGSLTISLGNPRPDKLPFTLSDAMGRILMDEPLRPGEGILHHPEGVDLMPADIQLSGMEVSLVNAMSRETILRQYLDTLKGQYSHILIDCQPSLGMLTVNALAAANRVIIPVQAEYLPAKGLEQLLQTVNKVKRQINPKLQIDGILLTMVDNRTNFAKEIAALLRDTYGSKIKVFKTEIPPSVKAKEASADGKSIYAHDPKGKVAEPWLVGKDVALALGYKNPQEAIRDHVDTEDKGVSEILTPGGRQKLPVINESGLYSLVLSSKLPKAKQFRRWVTSEVLPSIRKYGAYMTKEKLWEVATSPEALLKLCTDLLAEREENATLREENARLAGKAAFYDLFIDLKHSTNLRTTAKELVVPERQFVRFLLEQRFVYRTASGNVLPYAKPSNDGLFCVKDFCNHGHIGSYTLVTPQGKLHFAELRDLILMVV